MRKISAFALPYFCLATLLFCAWEGRDRTQVLRRMRFVDPHDGSAIEIIVRGYKNNPYAPHRNHHSAVSANPQMSGSQ